MSKDLLLLGAGGGLQDSDLTNQAVQLTSASSQYLSIADNADFSFGDEDFSFAGWVRFDTVSVDRTIISKLDAFSGGNEEYWLFLNGGSNQVKLWIWNNSGTRIGDVTTTGTFSANTWYFIECGHNATSNEVWISVNGGARDTAATSGIPFDGPSAFKFGANTSSNSELMNGRLDSWGIWNRALSTTDRDYLYNSGVGKKYSQLNAASKVGLISFYDYASGQIVVDGHGVNDLTNNGGATNTAGITA